MISEFYPIIKEKYHAPRKQNMFNVQTTFESVASNSFGDNILANSVIHNTFTKLLSYIEPWLYLKTNVKLINNDSLPLIGNESINMVFAGDNVINYYYDSHLKHAHQPKKFKNFLHSIVNPDNKNLFKSNSKYFKWSNFDFDINITTDSTNRYEIINQYVLESLIEILDFITDGLDAIYHFNDDVDNLLLYFANINLDSTNDYDLNIDYMDRQLEKIKNIMANANFNYSIELALNTNTSLNERARASNIQQITDITHYMRHISNQVNNIMYYPYIYYFTKATSQKNDFSMHDCGFNAKIKNEINNQFKILVKNQFYSTNKIKNMKKNIIHHLRAIKKHELVDIQSTNALYDDINVYNFANALNEKYINIISSDSQYIHNDYAQNASIKLSPFKKKVNCITVDQSFAMSTRNNYKVINNDIVKLQLKMVITNIKRNNIDSTADISAELVNIRIVRFSSSDYQRIVHLKHTTIDLESPHQYSDSQKRAIKIYTLPSLINELTVDLFDENHFLPWYSNNYHTKIIKLLYLIKIYNITQFNFLSDLLNSKSISDYIHHLVFFDDNFQFYSFYSLIWINNDTLNNNRDIQYFVKLILLMENLFQYNANKSNHILKIFQKDYGWNVDDINYTSTREKYIDFKKQLTNIIIQLKNTTNIL